MFVCVCVRTSVCIRPHAQKRYAGDPRLVPMRRSSISFHWAIAMDGAIHEAEAHVRSDNVAERGVPLPEGWRVALSACDLGSRATEACSDLEAVDDVSDLACSLAGVPKACTAGSDGELCPGTIVPLHTPSSARVIQNFVLCAHVFGNNWYCHAGSFEASEPGAPARGLLDEAGLVLKDIVTESCGEERPSKRIKRHARSSQLQSLLDSSPDDWRALVAIATLKAEQKRSRQNEHSPDWSVALAGFEPNLWKWEVVEGRASHARVYFLWTWHDAGSATVSWSFELTCHHLHNLLTRGDYFLFF